jgi:hypothetical protein
MTAHFGDTFSTSQMLACVPGLALDRYEQWIKRGVVVLPARVGKGTGKHDGGADRARPGDG